MARAYYPYSRSSFQEHKSLHKVFISRAQISTQQAKSQTPIHPPHETNPLKTQPQNHTTTKEKKKQSCPHHYHNVQIQKNMHINAEHHARWATYPHCHCGSHVPLIKHTPNVSPCHRGSHVPLIKHTHNTCKHLHYYSSKKKKKKSALNVQHAPYSLRLRINTPCRGCTTWAMEPTVLSLLIWIWRRRAILREGSCSPGSLGSRVVGEE